MPTPASPHRPAPHTGAPSPTGTGPSSPAPPTRLTTRADLLAVTGDAAVVRDDVVDPIGPAFTRDGATVLARATQAGDPDLVGLGPADALAALLSDVVPRLPHDAVRLGVNVEAASAAALDAVATGPARDRWRVMECIGDARVTPGPQRPVPVPTTRADEMTAFLDAHHTSRWSPPGRVPGEEWFGIERGGALAALGCLARTPAGTPRLSGIAVDGRLRGRGLGRALTAHLTTLGLARAGRVVLGVDEGHDAAEGLYLDLGFTVVHDWVWAPLA